MKRILSMAMMLIVGSVHAQNNCSTAITITPGTYQISTIDGTAPLQTCTPGDIAVHAEWFLYVPIQDATVTVSTDLPQNNPNGDTNFSVFTGSCNNLTCHSGDDDGGTLGDGYLSEAMFDVTAGTTYYIVFDNRWSSSGFSFELTEAGITPPVTPPITFTESINNNITANMNYCVVDLNGDYLDDILGVDEGLLTVQYQQANGNFTSQSIAIPDAEHLPNWSIAAGDLDSNGYNDLILGGGSGVTFLYATTNGTGYTTWSEPKYIFSQRTNFVDINNDGLLDVFVCHDVDSNVFFINQGELSLSYHKGGLGNHPNGGNYGSVWVDYDNDGDVDLFIAKCRGGNSTARFNELHRNEGNGVFTDVSVLANLYDPIQTWSSCWYDFDNDGDMDAFIGASSNADGLHKLMLNNNDGSFTDVTEGSNWETNSSMNIEHLAYDFDNDGFVDIFGGGQKIMRNNGDMTFSPYAVGFTPGPSGDLNNDGFIDIQNDNKIYFNDGNGNRWIKFTLQGVASNRNGIGARVELYGTWGKQIRDVRSGEGFRYMSTLNVHFGIGQALEIDSAIVKWPSGMIDYLYQPNVNSVHHIVEGSHPQQDPPISIAEIDQQLFSIYPNPTTDWLYFRTSAPDQSILSVSVYAVDGKRVLHQEYPSDGIQLAHLASGNYLLQIQATGDEVVQYKFTKK